MNCLRCGRELNMDDVGLSRKMIHRAVTQCFCVECLAGHFEVPAEKLYAQIERYRAAGCSLFSSAPNVSFSGGRAKDSRISESGVEIREKPQ